jgi:Domain of unknown function DUF11
MSDIKEQEHIDELRRRLYERGEVVPEGTVTRHKLTPREIEVSRGWGTVPGTNTPSPTTNPEVTPEVTREPEIIPRDVPIGEAAAPEPFFSALEPNATPPMTYKTKRRYRLFILVASLVFFVITAAVSSIYLFMGANQISAKNISLTLNAPLSIAGGEMVAMQVGITNQNSIPITSTTLIVNYPSGTRSADEEARELYEERIPVEDIAAGQAVNIPVRAVLYGEENEEKEIKVAVEYRVEGSSGTFFKEIDPQLIKITSSPLVVRVSGVDKISSGQEIELRLLVQSNSANVQKDILVSTGYPNSFTFKSADPEPAYGDNSWFIDELPPNGSSEIKIKGTVAGLANELSEIQVKVGNPELSNQFMMGSVLSQTRFSYTIEKPFTGVVFTVNGDSDGLAILEPGAEAEVRVKVENTLDEPIYDMRVEIRPEGNLIRDDLLTVADGYYDASSKVIRHEVSGDSSLAEVGPGQTREFTFRVKPDRGQSTASFKVSANVFARRVSEERASEALIGTSVAEVKYSSEADLGVELGYDNGPFRDTGAVPPVAGLATTYTITLVAEAGVNDMTGAVVTANLPQYISWLDVTKGDGRVEFNPVSKQLKWTAGDVSAKGKKTLSFQVSFLPSVTQVGRTAVVMGSQELKATDRFTGVALRAEGGALQNELSTELGFVRDNGIVQEAD